MKSTHERLKTARNLLEGALQALARVAEADDKEAAITVAFRRAEEATNELRQAIYNEKGWNHG